MQEGDLKKEEEENQDKHNKNNDLNKFNDKNSSNTFVSRINLNCVKIQKTCCNS